MADQTPDTPSPRADGGGPAGPGPDRPGPHLVVMGVSGSGKTSVGTALAQRLGLPYADADDLHPPENIAKQSRGEALTDEDRWPWLEKTARWLTDRPDGGVASCSALKRVYRDHVRHGCPGAVFVHLAGDPEVITARQAARQGHFMPASLMSSQLATLEPLAPDEPGLVLDVADPVEVLVQQVVDALAAGSLGGDDTLPGAAAPDGAGSVA